MKYSYALGLLTISLGSVNADECAKACTDAKNACLTKPDTNRAVCASEYASCLGYNPYGGETFVEPTACSHTDTAPKSTSPPVNNMDACAEACTDAKNSCLTKPDTNRAACAAEYASCLGYNPYGGDSFVEPTACSKGSSSTTAPVVPDPTAEVDACAKACTDKKNACMGAPDANHATCASEYASCLGYNPYEKQPFVEPTACQKDTTTPTATHEPPVVTAAGDKIQPAVALLALGAMALL